MGMFQKIEIS